MNYICLATNAQKNVPIWKVYSRLDCSLEIMCLKKSLKTIYYSVVHPFKCNLSEPVKISLHFETNANISFVVFGSHLWVDRGQEMQRYVHFITCWFSPTLTPFRKLMICGFYFTEISTVLPLLCDQLPVATSLKAWGFVLPTQSLHSLEFSICIVASVLGYFERQAVLIECQRKLMANKACLTLA